MTNQKPRRANPFSETGACSSYRPHGGDPDSVKFCHRIELTNVSCSPYRVPVARIAAAQAALEEEAADKAKPSK
jgi:pyruvate,orthophosphate dikinase